jgi:hypothetical protein
MRNPLLVPLVAVLFVATAQAPAASGPAAPPSPAAQSPALPEPDTSRIPPEAIRSVGLEQSIAWKWEHDEQTKGSSQAGSHYPIYPDGRQGLPGRQFVAYYGKKGGERYHLTFGRDPHATHFVYEANVYLVTPGDVQNVEMDMNQVLEDGQTVIFGTQCAAHSRSWEYTYVNDSGTHWHASNIACNPHDWGTKKWHRVQLAYHRDDDGNVTYDWVGFDGTYTDFQNATVFSAQSLHWSPGELLLNFQIDGAQNTGIMDAYLNNLTIYRW